MGRYSDVVRQCVVCPVVCQVAVRAQGCVGGYMMMVVVLVVLVLVLLLLVLLLLRLLLLLS